MCSINISDIQELGNIILILDPKLKIPRLRCDNGEYLLANSCDTKEQFKKLQIKVDDNQHIATSSNILCSLVFENKPYQPTTINGVLVWKKIDNQQEICFAKNKTRRNTNGQRRCLF